MALYRVLNIQREPMRGEENSLELEIHIHLIPPHPFLNVIVFRFVLKPPVGQLRLDSYIEIPGECYLYILLAIVFNVISFQYYVKVLTQSLKDLANASNVFLLTLTDKDITFVYKIQISVKVCYRFVKMNNINKRNNILTM